MFVAIMGEKKKMQNALSVLPFFSLSFPFSFVFLSVDAFSLLLYARNREDILIEREEKKRKKNEISLSNKNTTTTMLLLFTAYRPTRPTLPTLAGKKRRRKEKKEIRVCARL